MASLQDNIDAHGGALNLLRTNSVEVSGIFPYPLEWSNWRDEQRAWAETALLLNQSYHMTDLYMSGPDAVRLLSDTSVNNWSKFAIGGAKQYVAVNSRGQLIGDSIAIWLPDGRINVAGFEHTINWLQFQAEVGRYDVQFSRDPSSRGEAGSKRLYRYELEGPRAWDILEKASGAPVPDIGFFKSGVIRIADRDVWLLNHTMGGVPGNAKSGFELLGPAEDDERVVDALLVAGVEFGLKRGGARAYLSTLGESGWVGASQCPAIYTADDLRDYREWLPATALENYGIATGSGSYQPEVADGYYQDPYEQGYGHVVRFDHDFIGRAALETIAAAPPRTKVWLTWNAEETRQLITDSEFATGKNARKLLPWPNTVGRDQVLIGDTPIGATQIHGYTVNIGTWTSVASVDSRYAKPGTEVELLWGDWDGGASNPATPAHEQVRIRATISLDSLAA